MAKKQGRPITCRLCKVKFYKSEAEKPQWSLLKLPCPSCNSLYCCMPKQERELMGLQDLFYAENRNFDYLGKMFPTLFSYSRSLAFKTYGGIMDEEYHDEFAHEASLLVIMSYYKFPEFRIQKSFGGYLLRRFKQIEIFEMNDSVSINEVNDDNKEYFQLESGIDLLEEKNIYLEKINFLQKLMNTIINPPYKLSKVDNLYRIISLFQKITTGNDPTIHKAYVNRSKEPYLKSLSLFKKELLSRGK